MYVKNISSLVVFLLMFLAASELQSFDKVHFALTDEAIDVVIPCTDKDKITLDFCIEGIIKNCTNVRRIIVVSKEKLTDKAEWFDEKEFPFDKQSVAYYLLKGDARNADYYVSAANTRVGWYYQQLLKLYAPFVIPGVSSNVLLLDADTIFLNPVNFMDDKGNALYNPGSEFHTPYFLHMGRLLQGLRKVFSKYSGISHHMLVQRPVLEDLFFAVESCRQTEFWKAFCFDVDLADLHFSGASEYEIYFNYVFARTDQVKLRFLIWKNVSDTAQISNYKYKGYHYVSVHSWMKCAYTETY